MFLTKFKRLFLAISLGLIANHVYTQTEVKYSHNRGLYYSSFELILSANKNSDIWYSLDGSNPISNINSFKIASPVSIQINPYNKIGRALTSGIVVRACAITDTDTSEIKTNTYIFPEAIKFEPEVSDDVIPYWPNSNTIPCTFPENLVGWMRSNTQAIDLGIDAEVVYKDEYKDAFVASILSLPILSLVTTPDNLFGEEHGIYRNSTWSGREWEVPGSIELINPNGDDFQSNTGIRIRGGWSSSGYFAKHSFRLFFRSEYGNGKLNFPLFGDDGTDDFDKIDLRSSQNNGWHAPVGADATKDFIRDYFARSIQRDMGHECTRSKYYQLYLNGKYWGLYQTQERSEANFAESYFGGDKNDYDVVKSSGPSTDWEPYTLEATDGTLKSSETLLNITLDGFSQENYNKARGLNPDGTPNPNYSKLLDEINLADYILIMYYSAHTDGPAHFNDERINNFFGIYNRNNPDGFKYFVHDAEITFDDVDDDITNLEALGGSELSSFNPMWLHQQLLLNDDYVQLFADRAYKHLFNNGAISAKESIKRYKSIRDKINDAIVGESARWGDARSSSSAPFTRDEHWQPYTENFIDEYLAKRTDIVIQQLKDRGWLNDFTAPQLDESEFNFTKDTYFANEGTFSLINTNKSGNIYYTINGSDPRLQGGTLNPDAILYETEIEISGNFKLMARVKQNDMWSPLQEHVIFKNEISGLVISEINYQPIKQILGSDTLASKYLEFVEIKNTTNADIDISFLQLNEAIYYSFPIGSVIKADSLLVLASDTSAFTKLYDFKAFGQFTGNLNNESEMLKLQYPSTYHIFYVDYNYNDTWFNACDGNGHSLVYNDYEQVNNGSSKGDWRISTNYQGSPGKDDPERETHKIQITEVLSNSSKPYTDAIELFNTDTTNIDISYWYLSDEKGNINKWQIPKGTIIKAKSYLTFYEGTYSADNLVYNDSNFGSSFSVSSGGEEIMLFKGDSLNQVSGFECSIDVEPTLDNISYGEYTDASLRNHMLLLANNTFDTVNSDFKKSPICINQIMYNPIGENCEYLVLKNRTDSIVKLYHPDNSEVTWKINGIGFTFPEAITIASGDSVFIIESKVNISDFRQSFGLTNHTQVFNYYGKLKNSGETLKVLCPIEKDNVSTEYSYAALETISYSDDSPWPTNADGDGFALQRISSEKFGNINTNWTSVKISKPDAHAGNNQRIKLGSDAILNGSQSNSFNNGTLSYNWNIVKSPDGASTELKNKKSETASLVTNALGEHVVQLVVVENGIKSLPSYTSILVYNNQQPIAITNKQTFSTSINEQIEISAIRSYDPDYDEITYRWNIVEKPESSTLSVNGISPELKVTPDIAGTYKIELLVNDGNIDSEPLNIKVNAAATTIFAENNELVKLYPNPTSDHFTIESNSTDITKIEIMDLAGKTIFHKTIAIPKSKQAIKPNLYPGLYLVKISSGKNYLTSKLTIK